MRESLTRVSIRGLLRCSDEDTQVCYVLRIANGSDTYTFHAFSLADAIEVVEALATAAHECGWAVNDVECAADDVTDEVNEATQTFVWSQILRCAVGEISDTKEEVLMLFLRDTVAPDTVYAFALTPDNVGKYLNTWLKDLQALGITFSLND